MYVRRQKSKVLFLFLVFLLIFSYFSKSDDIKEFFDIGWYQNSSLNLSDYLEYEKTYSNKNLYCQSNKTSLIVIAVASAPKNFERRHAIRKTWGNTTYFNHNFFDKIHTSSKGKFLKIDRNKWQHYLNSKTIFFLITR